MGAETDEQSTIMNAEAEAASPDLVSRELGMLRSMVNSMRED